MILTHSPAIIQHIPPGDTVNEQSKAAKRRAHDLAFHNYFAGVGIDVGSGADPFHRVMSAFPRVRHCRAFDKGDGDAATLPGLPENSFDFLVSSHCLEHLTDPAAALARWIEVVRPSGHIVVTVPDFDLYECGEWPSRFNPDHKVAFSLHRPAVSPIINVVELLAALRPLAGVERVQLVRDFYDTERAGTDQTLTPNVESAIEFVLRKNR